MWPRRRRNIQPSPLGQASAVASKRGFPADSRGKKGVTTQCKPRLAADELASWHARGGQRCRCRAWTDGRSEPLFISSHSWISPPPPPRLEDPTQPPPAGRSTGEQRGAGGKLGRRREVVVLMRCAVPQRRRRASNQARRGVGHSVANSHRIHAASRFLHTPATPCSRGRGKSVFVVMVSHFICPFSAIAAS